MSNLAAATTGNLPVVSTELAPLVPISPGVSLGRTVLQCNGIQPKKTDQIVVMNSFVTGPEHANGKPFGLLPEPEGDAYLNFMVIPGLAPGETVLCLRLQPGVLDYYTSIGLIQPSNSVIEVDPKPGSQGELGFPFTDPISLLRQQVPGGATALDPVGYLVATFPSQPTDTLADEVGLRMVQRLDVATANDKAAFRKASEKWGFTMCPGMCLSAEGDIATAAGSLSDASRVWMKLAQGSGGDLVIGIDGPITEEALRSGIHAIRESVIKAFQVSDYGSYTIDDYWPASATLPVGSTITVERDAKDFGEPIFNGSNSMIINQSGEMIPCGYYYQIISPEGNFCGSATCNASPEIMAAINEEIGKVAAYAASSEGLNLRGHCGCDYYVVREPSGEYKCLVYELNGRPIISFFAHMVAMKLSAPHMININIEAPEPILTMGDVERLLTVDGINLTRPNETGVLVVPLAIRTLYTDQGTCYESPIVKVGIFSPNEEAGMAIMKRIRPSAASFKQEDY